MLQNALMLCTGFEAGTVGRKTQTNPIGYGLKAYTPEQKQLTIGLKK